MSQAAGIWLLIVLAAVAANLPLLKNYSVVGA